MVTLIISLVNFVIGTFFRPLAVEEKAEGLTGYSTTTFTDNLYAEWRGETFISIFTIYFPSVIGFMAGPDICGDLKVSGTFLGIPIIQAICSLSSEVKLSESQKSRF